MAVLLNDADGHFSGRPTTRRVPWGISFYLHNVAPRHGYASAVKFKVSVVVVELHGGLEPEGYQESTEQNVVHV